MLVTSTLVVVFSTNVPMQVLQKIIRAAVGLLFFSTEPIIKIRVINTVL